MTEKVKRFDHFVNSEETEPGIKIVDERGQKRPLDWPKEVKPTEISERARLETKLRDEELHWVAVGNVVDFPKDGGATIKFGKTQIAVFNMASRGEWYACQNMCPHKQAFVLSRGLVGDVQGTPKVACPLHKKTFNLINGKSMTNEDYCLYTFPIKVVGEEVFIQLPDEQDLDQLLATDLHCIGSCHAAPERAVGD